MIKKIRIPVFKKGQHIEQEIESLILNLIPNINNKTYNLSKQWTDRILIYFNFLIKNVSYNELESIEDRPLKGAVKYVQLCQVIKTAILSKKEVSMFSTTICDNVLSKYIKVREFDSPIHGTVPLFAKGIACKQYYFTKQVVAYLDYQVQTKTALNVLESVRRHELWSNLLSSEQQEVRRSVIRNTDKIILLKNPSSVQILSKQLSQISMTPTEYINSFCNNSSRIVICDNFGRRCHHKLTRLKKSLHQHLRVDNKAVISLDFKNSQPAILSLLFESCLIPKLVEINPDLKYLEKVSLLFDKYRNEKDVILFRSLSLNGKLYEYLRKNYRLLNSESITRDKIKGVIFLAMFSDYSKHKTNRYYQRKNIKRSVTLFKHCFPSVYQMIQEIQKVNLNQSALEDKKIGQEMRKNLPYILQQVESTIMLDVVCKALYDHNIEQEGDSQLFYSTIHDSIVTIHDNVKMIEMILLACFVKIGIPPPQINIE